MKSDFRVLVKTHYFNNPHSLLSDGECCDFNETGRNGSCAVPGCDILFQYCLLYTEGHQSCKTSKINYRDAAPINFSAPTFLGLSNPLSLIGLGRNSNPNVSFLMGQNTFADKTKH